MLFFLNLGARRGFVVDQCSDAARGRMARNAQGRMAMTKVILNPRVAYADSGPDCAMAERLHHIAHELCYIASVTVETCLGGSQHTP
jgi:organic hydroperoxide reductase OsmC/OhrA